MDQYTATKATDLDTEPPPDKMGTLPNAVETVPSMFPDL
jgi:hypothetical protein